MPLDPNNVLSDAEALTPNPFRLWQISQHSRKTVTILSDSANLRIDHPISKAELNDAGNARSLLDREHRSLMAGIGLMQDPQLWALSNMPALGLQLTMV